MKTLSLGLLTALFASTTALAQEGDDATWIRRAHHEASPSVVTIRCGARMGTGFLFQEDRVVASTDRWDRCTRGIEVVLLSGAVLPVDVGRVSSEHGVALLRLSAAAGGDPLEPRTEPVQVGDHILIVDRVRRGGRVAIAGRVSAESGATVRTDIRDEDIHGGAPALDAEGRVVGIATRRHRSDRVHVVPVERLLELDQAPEASLGFPLSLDLGLVGALVWDEDPEVADRGVMLGGFGASLRMTLFDRIALVASYAHLRDTSELFETAGLVERSAARHQAEASLGWRFLGFYGVNAYITPSVGAAARWTEWTDRQLQIELEDPACDPSAGPCDVVTTLVETETDDFSITPYVRLALSAGFGEIAYSLALALDAPGDLVHQLSLTAWLGGNR